MMDKLLDAVEANKKREYPDRWLNRRILKRKTYYHYK